MNEHELSTEGPDLQWDSLWDLQWDYYIVDLIWDLWGIIEEDSDCDSFDA